MLCRHGMKLERVGDRFFDEDVELKECAVSQDTTFTRVEKLMEGLRAALNISAEDKSVQ
jgi:hypothetical protein